ncbi:hypothetical protein [Tolypothrix sp. FACHB-123]|nr:hypothetical protein [Tolypothrix sp. FACHB-123]
MVTELAEVRATSTHFLSQLEVRSPAVMRWVNKVRSLFCSLP